MPLAQHNLGLLALNGRGIAKNPTEAASWFQRAAKQGEPNAQNALGALYERGEGVPKDIVQAYVWFNLATARLPAGTGRDRATANRDRVVKLLSAPQRTQAQQVAAGFTAQSEIAAVTPPPTRPATPANPAPTNAPPAPNAAQADQIRGVQSILAGLGYDPGVADGNFGAKTRAAISAFQDRVGLPVDGQISNNLLAKLRDAAATAGLGGASPAGRAAAILSPPPLWHRGRHRPRKGRAPPAPP